MKVMVLGGDGFCGWPTSLHLSSQGYDVVIVDNFSRRRIDIELGANSLTPIATMQRRISTWNDLSEYKIRFVNCDVAKDYSQLLGLILETQPDAIVHFAEQRAAPYSMKGSYGKRYTVDNNVSATNNVLAAIVEAGLDIHLVHLGTMGVYGYSTQGLVVPEGYVDARLVDAEGTTIEQKILYPTNPGSIYHLTKTHDALTFAFYNKNDGVRVTDLHQGIVWGGQTDQTILHEDLVNRFDYDGEYGTVLNRFLIQAAIGHHLTVHGTGQQTRAFINLQDSVRCIEIALKNPPAGGEPVKILNQMTETFSLIELAELISEITGAEIAFLQNPRNEMEKNKLAVRNDSFLDLGLKPILLRHDLLSEIMETVKRFAHRCDQTLIPCRTKWSLTKEG